MLSEREPDQRSHTGRQNLVCRHGGFGLQVLDLNMNLANVKKIEIFCILKIQTSGFS